MRKILAHRIDLALDGVARYGALGPTFGHHGAQPDVSHRKQGGLGRLRACCIERNPVQGKVRCSRQRGTRQHGLKLWAAFEALQNQVALAQRVKQDNPKQIRRPDACGLWRDGR